MASVHRLWTFGTAELEDPSGQRLTLQPKRTALAAYLLLVRPGRMQRRDALVGLSGPTCPPAGPGRPSGRRSMTFGGTWGTTR